MPPGCSRSLLPRPSPDSVCLSRAASACERTTELQQRGLRTSVLPSWESPADRVRAEVDPRCTSWQNCWKAQEFSRLKRAKDLGDVDYSGAFAQIRFLPVGHLRRNS